MNFKLLFICLLLLSGVTTLFAQDSNEKRHIEVRVELNNDSELEGIIVDSRFYEKYDEKKNRWKVMPSRKGSGVRLYHVEKAEGFIYLSYETDIKHIEEIGRKSREELKELRAEIERAKKAQLEKDREEELKLAQEQQDRENGKEEKDKEEVEDSSNEGELNSETLRRYEELLEKFPPDKFKLQKIVDATKIRMLSGVSLARTHKDFLNNFAEWRKALAYKNETPPIKSFNKEQLEESLKLLARFPADQYQIETKIKAFSTRALQELPILPNDEEWLRNLDKWLDAQVIVALSEEKAVEENSKGE